MTLKEPRVLRVSIAFLWACLLVVLFAAPVLAGEENARYEATDSTGIEGLGMALDHLNMVAASTDAEAVTTFYRDVLGLEQLETWSLPSSGSMLRFQAGASQLKFIVYDSGLREFSGKAGDARGLRLLALLLPESKRSGIETRLAAHGHPALDYTENLKATIPYRYGMVFDPDGNQVELVFLDDAAPEKTFEQIQLGLTVSDSAAANHFLGEILRLEKIGTNKSQSGTEIHRYAVGKSQIKFWSGSSGLPAHVGAPWDMRGLSLLQFVVRDVDAVRADVLRRGGKIHTEPFRLGNSTIMFVEGPDGTLFEFAGPLLERLENTETLRRP